MDLDSSTALVTGAGSGIGRGIARSLAGCGARLALTDLDPKSLAAVADELGHRTEVVADQLDVLVDNSGFAFPESIADTDYPSWDLLLGVNLGE